MEVNSVKENSSMYVKSNENSSSLISDKVKIKKEDDVSVWSLMTRDKLLSVLTFCFANFCTGAFYALPGPFFPQEASMKRLSITKIGVVFSTYELVIILSTPLYGTFLTKLGAKFTYNAGIFVAGTCAVLFGFLDMVPAGTTFFVLALLIRTVEGIGIAALFTASYAIIAHTFPSKAAAMVGTLESFTGLGMMIGPPIGGVLYQYGGFGMPFWTTGALLLVSGLITIFSLPSQKFERESRGSMIALLRIPLVTIVACFVASGALCMGFLDVSLALHLDEVYGFSPMIIGLIFLVGPGAYAFSSPFFGWLSDKFPKHSKQALLIGFAINAFGFVFLGPAPFLNLSKDKWWLNLVSLLCFGFGIGTIVMSFQIISQIAIEHGIGESLKTFGFISGIFNTFFSLGAFFGPILGGFMVDTLGFEWAAFGIGAANAFMCVLLVMYLIIGKLCSRYLSSRQHGSQPANERAPLLIST